MTKSRRPRYREAIKFMANEDVRDFQIGQRLDVEAQAKTPMTILVSKMFDKEPMEIAVAVIRCRKLGGSL